MADLKISQLPEVTGQSVNDGSTIIVNENDGGSFTTKQALISQLFGGATGSGVTFHPPQTRVMSDVSNSDSANSRLVDNITYQWQRRSPFVVKTSATHTIDVPPGTTHAIVYFTSWNRWDHANPPGPDNGIFGHARQYVEHRLYCVSGGIFPNGAAGGTYIKAPYTHTVPYKQSLPQDSNDRYYSHKSGTKTKLMTISGTTVSFKADILLVMGGFNKMNAYVGDIVVLPFTASTTQQAASVGALMGATLYSDDDIGLDDGWEVGEDVAKKSAAIFDGNQLRGQAKYLIDIVDDYIVSYDEITGGGTIPNDLETTLMTLKKRIHATTFSSMKLNADGTLTPLETQPLVQAEMTEIYNEINTLLIVPFTFEVNAGVTKSTPGLRF